MATYDLLATYPENVPCENCGRIIGQTFYTTISGRVVCSQKCSRELFPSPEDSCYICGKPVWEDEYYATRTKYFCSEKCKDIYQNDPNSQSVSSLKNSIPFQRAKDSNSKYSQEAKNGKKYISSKKYERYGEPRNPFFEIDSNSSKIDQKIKNSHLKCFHKDSVKAVCNNCGRNILGPEVVIFSSTGQYCSHRCLKEAEGNY